MELEMLNITKRFPGVLACDNITLKLKEGEILALLGENGAGKTTLMNILYGLYKHDEGSIVIDGETAEIDSPNMAFELGIGMVHQHFMLVPNLTVLENIALGFTNKKIFRLDLQEIKNKILEISMKYDLKVNPDAYVWQLSVGEQQRVELVKTLCLGAKILILDEPTAALTPQETDELLMLLKKMADTGCSVIFISHKLNEVKTVSDNIVILRNGKLVYKGAVHELSQEELAEKMSGREIHIHKNTALKKNSKDIITLNNVWAKNDKNLHALKGLSLTIKEGEILGIAGVSGNGQKELAEVINGIREAEKGEIYFGDKNITNMSTQNIINEGMGYIPEDRNHEGIVPSFSIKENLILKDYFKEAFSKGSFLKEKNIIKNAKELIKKFSVKCPDINTVCGTLSGGNIQKVIFAREITRNPKALIAAYPIRGLDIGAAEYVHSKLLESRDNNMGIMVISEELEELLNICDRIAVIYEGEILDILEREDFSKSKIGLLMAGVSQKGGEKNYETN